jgi:hypothetical protein
MKVLLILLIASTCFAETYEEGRQRRQREDIELMQIIRQDEMKHRQDEMIRLQEEQMRRQAEQNERIMREMDKIDPRGLYR